nr:glutathione S-transferase family protein [Hyphomonas sp. Mor2]
MKLYDYPGAPNPRRVKIFAAEKGIELNLVLCDMRQRAHKTEAFLKKNPSGKIPVLELEDGRCIPESVAICRYLEAIQPEPNLFGRDAFEQASIEARHRHIEHEFWREVGISWVHGPIVAQLGLIKTIPEAKVASDKNLASYYQRLDQELSQTPFIAGDRFTIADITLLTGVDFASTLVGVPPDEGLANLARWRKEVGDRPSVKAADDAIAV